MVANIPTMVPIMTTVPREQIAIPELEEERVRPAVRRAYRRLESDVSRARATEGEADVARTTQVVTAANALGQLHVRRW